MPKHAWLPVGVVVIVTIEVKIIRKR